MPAPRRHALLAGVDRYPHFDESSQLRSCVHDVRLMADVLANELGFRPGDMTLLLDGAATREALLAGLADLRVRARPGDAVVFYWSGHGSQMEEEGAGDGVVCETIVPVDSGREPQENRDIADREIYSWLLTLGEVTANVAVIADTCFSGGVVRDSWGEKWVAPDSRPCSPDSRPCPRPPAAGAAQRGAPLLRDVGPSGFLPLDERYVLLAACRFREHAKELKSRPYSAFTYFLTQELLRAPAGATYRDVMERVRLAVTAEVTDQTPQVEGARDRVLFGAAERPPRRFLPVVERRGRGVVLGGGTVHGVDAGATWALYPPGTREPHGAARLGLVRVDTVGTLCADAAIVEETGAIAPGLRAFEQSKGPGWLRLAVELDAESLAPAERRMLAAALRRSPLLAPAPAGAGAVRVAGLEPRGPEPERGTRAVRAGAPSWLLLGAEGELLRAPLAREGRGAAARLAAELESLARARNLIALEESAESPLTGRLEIELLRGRGGEALAPALPDAGGDTVFQEGDRIALRIVQRAGMPLYLHVLDIGPSGSIRPIFPVPGANEPLDPGGALEIGMREGARLAVAIPPELAERCRATGSPCVAGRETLKVFATAGEADLSGWEQPGWREERAGRGGLAALLARALAGGALRGEGPQGDSGELWTVATRSFLVRARPYGADEEGGR
jgi:hypothetical protein